MIIYTIKKGDTLYQIAKKYQVTLQSIISINQLTDINNLVIGQTILIPTLPIIEVNGYCYPNINRNVFQKTLPFLTYVSIFSYQVNVDGTLTILNDEELISNALRENVAPMLIITNINKEGSFDSNLAHEILVNRNVQSNLINNLLDIMKKKNYYGLGIDFEYILPKDRANYNYFLSKVVEVMHANHYIVTTALAPKIRYDQPGTLYEAHDYYAHGKYADHVILMTYEWGYTYGPPMAVSPIDQVEKEIGRAHV